jgi:hypothetical protein
VGTAELVAGGDEAFDGVASAGAVGDESSPRSVLAASQPVSPIARMRAPAIKTADPRGIGQA